MRVFTVTSEFKVHANSFAEAERKAQKVMADAFNASVSEVNPIEFMTKSISKGEEVK